jgi:hypothetical protein
MIAQVHHHENKNDQTGAKASLSDRLIGQENGFNLCGHQILIWMACSQTNGKRLITARWYFPGGAGSSLLPSNFIARFCRADGHRRERHNCGKLAEIQAIPGVRIFPPIKWAATIWSKYEGCLLRAVEIAQSSGAVR